jgi:hypothetical protein
VYRLDDHFGMGQNYLFMARAGIRLLICVNMGEVFKSAFFHHNAQSGMLWSAGANGNEMHI